MKHRVGVGQSIFSHLMPTVQQAPTGGILNRLMPTVQKAPTGGIPCRTATRTLNVTRAAAANTAAAAEAANAAAAKASAAAKAAADVHADRCPSAPVAEMTGRNPSKKSKR